MNQGLTEYLDRLFASYEATPTAREMKEEMLNNLQEKLRDFKKQGLDDETAFGKTVNSIGDISEILGNTASKSGELLEIVDRNFKDRDLRDFDMKRVKIHGGNFNDSTLKGADFSGSDLTGSTFKHSEVKNVRFVGTNLTGAEFYMGDLRDTNFTGSVLDNTNFNGADLSRASFDSLTFSGTIFDNALLKGVSFRNAVLRNVSFREAIDVKKANFDGATLDKFTYAALKVHNANLSGVTIS